MPEFPQNVNENHASNGSVAVTPKGLQPSTWKRNGPSQTTMRNAAVALAKWGAFVLPTHGVVKAKGGGYECSCDDYARKQAEKRKREWKPCTKIGKVPWGLKWQDDATNDPEVAYAIWSERKHHYSNIGILCGARSGLVGLDIDGETGLDSLTKLEAKFGKLPHTVTVKTGSGGRHYWFRLPEGVEISNSAKALGADVLGVEATNVDVRGTNGQLITAPSMHKSGNQYEFLEGCGIDDIAFEDVPLLPQWLVDECEKAKASNRNSARSARSAESAKAEQGVKSSPESQGCDAFADAGDAMGGGHPHGVDAFLALIGDGDGQLGFNDPIWKACLSYFASEGPDAEIESILGHLRGAISKAVRKPDRGHDTKYDSDLYLIEQAEKARAQIADSREREAKAALENVEAQIESLNLDTPDSALDSIFAALGALDISNARRDGMFEEICKKIGIKGNAKTSLKSRLTPHVKAAASKRQNQKAKKAIREAAGGLPDIDTSSGFNEMLSAAVKALAEKNKGRDAFLFDLDGQKVVIDGDKVKPIGVDEMQAEMRRVATWIAKSGDDLGTVDCPRNVATDLHVYRGHATPKLERFTRTPAFASDGKLIVELGYHESAKVYYSPTPGFVVPEIPANPTDEQIKQAVDFILDNVLCDFPFDDGEDPETGGARGGASSRAHAFALLLLGFMRDLIPGPTPIHLITKPLPGTGASLLVEALTTIPLGSPVASKVETSEEEERKEMIAFLRKAGLYYWKDNLQRKLQGSVIATAATNKTFGGRVLGQSEEVELAVRCIFVASGNNVPLADEVARRCLVIRLDAKRDPKKGRIFKHLNRPGFAGGRFV